MRKKILYAMYMIGTQLGIFSILNRNYWGELGSISWCIHFGCAIAGAVSIVTVLVCINLTLHKINEDLKKVNKSMQR